MRLLPLLFNFKGYLNLFLNRTRKSLTFIKISIAQKTYFRRKSKKSGKIYAIRSLETLIDTRVSSVNLEIALVSLEDRLSAIEKQYNAAYDRLSHMSGARNSYQTREDYLNKSYIAESIKTILLFQRSIEILYEDTKKLVDTETKYYISRCADNLELLRFYLRGGAKANGVCDLIDIEKFEEAFSQFQRSRSTTFQICEDVRLIYALRIYPIEEKIALKSQLSDRGFLEVVKCLDEAETNLAEKHFKDCIDRSREALEKTVSSILVTEKKIPSNYFSTDIGNMVGLGIIDKESKRLIEATYSYLSEVGAHGRGGDIQLGDAHYSMKETYMRVDILLRKYASYRPAK